VPEVCLRNEPENARACDKNLISFIYIIIILNSFLFFLSYYFKSSKVIKRKI
jgi:hypothetical protein